MDCHDNLKVFVSSPLANWFPFPIFAVRFKKHYELWPI
jgi:hypothetical protein